MATDTTQGIAAALAALRSGEEPLSAAQVSAFLEAVTAETEPKRARAAMAELIDSPRLGLAELERVARSDPKFVRGHEARIRRTYLSRRLAEEVSPDLFEQVIESRDAAIQTELIRDPRLSKKQAGELAKRGANPTIRQNAQSWFQDKKAWK
ncbi:MAG: hypothetical protein VX546_03735 [Myxococcota bacterium]|nr:hypothetical protein [Myxococcota bacterium]